MAKEVAKGGKVYVDGFDLTTEHTNIELALAQEAVESNCMQSDGAGTAKFMQEFELGLKSFQLTHSGYEVAGAGEIGTVTADRFGVAGTIFTVTGALGAEGDPAYSGYATNYQYQEIDGSVGGMAGYAAAGFGQGTPCFRGLILGTGTKSTTGNGGIYQLGAIASGTNALYAALHVVGATGSDLTFDVDLYSDADVGFASPTLRASFTQVAAANASEIISLATTVTDTWWRATWTVSTDDTFTIALNAGIITV